MELEFFPLQKLEDSLTPALICFSRLNCSFIFSQIKNHIIRQRVIRGTNLPWKCSVTSFAFLLLWFHLQAESQLEHARSSWREKEGRMVYVTRWAFSFRVGMGCNSQAVISLSEYLLLMHGNMGNSLPTNVCKLETQQYGCRQRHKERRYQQTRVMRRIGECSLLMEERRADLWQ